MLTSVAPLHGVILTGASDSKIKNCLIPLRCACLAVVVAAILAAVEGGFLPPGMAIPNEELTARLGMILPISAT